MQQLNECKFDGKPLNDAAVELDLGSGPHQTHQVPMPRHIRSLVRTLNVLPLSLAVLLTGSSIVILSGAIAPPAVQSYTSRVTVLIDRRTEGDFDTLINRAEGAARAGVQRSFDRDILVSQASVTVVAENNGSFVPILTLDVSRTQWKSFPDPQRWATYYRSAKKLLGLSEQPSDEK